MISPNHMTFSSKEAARAWALEVRNGWDEEHLAALGRQCIARLLADPDYRACDTLLTYLGAKRGELDTRPLIEAAWRDGKTVLVPVTYPRGRMAWSRLRTLALRQTRLGLLEPEDDEIDLVNPDGGLCVVPGLCFRPDGHRVGFGGGYFDRFLEGFGGSSVALCAEALYGVAFPVEPHDQAVQRVITETSRYDTR